MRKYAYVLFAAASLSLPAQLLKAASVQVGTCKASLISFSTIGAAVFAAPSGGTVYVCPGTYAEQLDITKPLSLVGAANGAHDQATITPPPSGLGVLVPSSSGVLLAPQILVAGVSPVNISNLTFDGGGSNVACGSNTEYQMALAYRGASGVINHVVIRNQTPGGCGYGVWAESAGGTTTLTVENSSIHNFDAAGVSMNLSGGSLTATVTSNWLRTAPNSAAAGIQLFGTAGSVSKNNIFMNASGPSFLSGYGIGVDLESGSTATISGNTIFNSYTGVQAASPDAKVTGNYFLNGWEGVVATSTGATISLNTFQEELTAIQACNAGPISAEKNKINDAASAGIWAFAGSALTSNIFTNVNVTTITCD